MLISSEPTRSARRYAALLNLPHITVLRLAVTDLEDIGLR